MEFTMKEVGFQTTLPYGELHVAGDEAYGFRPYQLLAASIAVCSGGVLRKVLEKKRLHVEDMTIRADVKRNEAKANRIEKVHLHFVIQGNGLREEQIAKSLEVARKNCPMVQSVEGSIEVTESFELVTDRKVECG
ncbi:OsmC family protein [Thermaerobacillus caldiproteolyticus]|uniref:Putative OsmC-like protein n=1 Tax=Thermaerobacillus caldiproteolyticus TaxID=247480 RepID=A0A7V9Z9K6_9BACL|nr:OsmC family protein [Anoxybacillus caldiproteolyticus]MBA2876480.1 putative OsmC-like protein [Anoxybacillus caldiproteolyticus]QPA31343.1 OsmC family protein [Anoxybacillus caldiproteolyticus]